MSNDDSEPSVRRPEYIARGTALLSVSQRGRDVLATILSAACSFAVASPSASCLGATQTLRPVPSVLLQVAWYIVHPPKHPHRTVHGCMHGRCTAQARG